MAADFDPANWPADWAFTYTKTIHNATNSYLDPSKRKFEPGHTVVVVGAGYGIGEYIARAYAHASATNIIITSRTASKLEGVKATLESIAKDAGRSINVSIHAGDATDPQSFVALRKLIEDKYDGRVDSLINNVGGGGQQGETSDDIFSHAFHDQPIENLRSLTVRNYLAPAYSIHALLPLLLRSPNKDRVIVNITSAAAHMVQSPMLAYNVAKLALNRLNECIATQYADQGVRLIALHPGGVKTPGTSSTPEWMQKILVDGIDMAGAVCVWFSADPKLKWLSGRYVSAQWDMEEVESREKEIVEKDALKWRMTV